MEIQKLLYTRRRRVKTPTKQLKNEGQVNVKKPNKYNLCGNSSLFDNHFLACALHGRGLTSHPASWSVWKPMSRHIFTVCFSYNAEGSGVGVRYICDRVSVQRRLVGDRTNLLDWELRAWLGAASKGRIKSFVVAERYESPGAQASSWLLGGCGGILWCRLRNILIQTVTKGIKTIDYCYF